MWNVMDLEIHSMPSYPYGFLPKRVPGVLWNHIHMRCTVPFFCQWLVQILHTENLQLIRSMCTWTFEVWELEQMPVMDAVQ